MRVYETTYLLGGLVGMCTRYEYLKSLHMCRPLLQMQGSFGHLPLYLHVAKTNMFDSASSHNSTHSINRYSNVARPVRQCYMVYRQAGRSLHLDPIDTLDSFNRRVPIGIRSKSRSIQLYLHFNFNRLEVIHSTSPRQVTEARSRWCPKGPKGASTSTRLGKKQISTIFGLFPSCLMSCSLRCTILQHVPFFSFFFYAQGAGQRTVHCMGSEAIFCISAVWYDHQPIVPRPTESSPPFFVEPHLFERTAISRCLL